MVKHKRGFIFNLHVGSIIRPLWSAGFEWELRLFATASQPVWHLMACGQLRQELSLSLPVSLFVCLLLSLLCARYAANVVCIRSVAPLFSRKHAIGSHPFGFSAFILLFLSLLLCDCLNEDLIEPNPLICSDSDILPENFAQIVLGFIWVNVESLSGSCE